MSTKLDVKQGDKYGLFTILEECSERGKDREFKCLCECGNIKVVRLLDLRRGHAKSCGCYRSKLVTKTNTTHNQSRTKLYSIYHTMKARCSKESDPRYKYYGARGITVCDEWQIFERFSKWANNNGYTEGLSIERVDVNGNYEPSNCTWIPKADQPKNARSNINITIDGETKYLQEWCRVFDINRNTVLNRVSRKGWSYKKALTTPIKAGTKK